MKQKILKSLLVSLVIVALSFVANANEATDDPVFPGGDPNDYPRDTEVEGNPTEIEGAEGYEDLGSDSGIAPYEPGTYNGSTDNSTLGTGGRSSGATGAWGEGLDKAREQGLPDGTLSEIIFNLASWLLLILGSFAVIGFAISGILYLTATGEEDRMEKAKKGMIYSVIGVIVGLLGYVVVQAVDTWFRGNDFF